MYSYKIYGVAARSPKGDYHFEKKFINGAELMILLKPDDKEPLP